MKPTTQRTAQQYIAYQTLLLIIRLIIVNEYTAADTDWKET